MAKSKHCGCGCFLWVVSAGKAINKRFAQARNAIIGRFRKANPEVKTRDLVNETGTPDLVLSKRPVSHKQATVTKSLVDIPQDITLPNEVPDASNVQAQQSADVNEDGVSMTARVRTETASLTSSTISVLAETAVRTSLTSIAADARIVDDQKPAEAASMTDSVISNIADTAVRASLTNIATEVQAASASRISVDKKPDDTASITSSVISDIAETAVRKSLTDIASADANQSAKTQAPAETKVY